MDKTVTFPSVYVVVDIDGFPMFPTVSVERKDAVRRMIRLGPPGKTWDFYQKAGYSIHRVKIKIEKLK